MDTNTDEALQLAKMLGTAGTVAVIAGTALKVADVTAQKYEKALPGIDSLLQVYGSDNQNKGSSRLNANVGLDLRNELLDYNKGTGLSNEDFISYSTQLGRYGIDDVKKGGQITQDAAFWSRYTGMRMESALGFMGTVERLGGDGRKTLDEVYGNAIASGIDKNQFPEFLDGVQRAIETGVSQGFIRSAKDVSESLSLLSRLSGGDPTWQGEYGVQRYNQMVSGMANNTSLNSTASMIMYRAANNMVEAKGAKDLLGQNKFLQDNGANWINTMAYIEKGDLSGEFLSNLKKVVDANFGDNTASKVLTYKEQFGLNYQGAIEFYKALEKLGSGANEESIKSEIEKITQNKEFKSDNTKLLDALNSIDSSVVNLGQSTFNVKMNGLEALSGVVENIYKEIRKEKGYVQTAKALGKEFFLDSEDKTHLTYIGKMAEENRGEDEQYFIELDNVINSVPKHLRADLADRLKKLDPNTQKTAKDVYEFVKQIIEEDVLVPHWGRGNLNPNGTQTFLTPEGEASASDYLKFAQMGRLQAFANNYGYTVESLIEDILAIKTKNGGVKFENAYDKAAEGGFDENEKNQLSLLLEKILEELQSGINVN